MQTNDQETTPQRSSPDEVIVEQPNSPVAIKSPVKATVKSPSQPTVKADTANSGIKENVPVASLSPPKVTKENIAPMSPLKVPVATAPPPQSEALENDAAQTSAGSEEPKLFVVEEHHETEEVIERLLDVKGLEQSVSGLWGWMSGGVSKVAEQANKVAEKASVVAKEASQQASLVAEKASQHATIVAEKASQQANIVVEKAGKAKAIAEQQAKELAATVSKTMEDKPANETKSPIAISSLPWETAHPERRAEARERIMKLSMDDHTFTVPPPKEANYVYDAVGREPYAARMLDTDALLSAKRFKLVPKSVDESEFWRNYFYRVDLILSALGLPATPAKPSDEKSNEKSDAKASAAAKGEAAHQRDLEEEMRQEIARVEASHLEDAVKDDENFDMLEDDLEFEDDDAELEKSLNDLKL